MLASEGHDDDLPEVRDSGQEQSGDTLGILSSMLLHSAERTYYTPALRIACTETQSPVLVSPHRG